jgi:hypothetical protein
MGLGPLGAIAERAGFPWRRASMPALRLRVRTLMAVVGLAALFTWGAMMALRPYNYYRLAREYGFQE